MADGDRIKFGPFEADLKTCELYRRGNKIPIQQKPFQILAVLVQRAGELVTREELHQLLWPDTFVQKNLSLNTAVRKLRLALGDHGRRYVETVGSRGYRFAQKISVSGLGDGFQVPSVSRRIRLAVVPLENLSGTDNETFADGLTEQLIARLGRLSEHVSVIAPVSSMQYKRTVKNAAQICKDLHCDYILSGSVLRAGSSVRVTAKLIRGNDQSCVWTESFSSGHTEIMALQDEIAIQIAHALKGVLPSRGGQQTRGPRHPDVLAKYLKATAFAGQAFESGFENAARLLREALELEPDFAMAHADLARLYANAAMFAVMPADELFRAVRLHASAALSNSDQVESAHVAIGYLHFYYETKWDEAEQSFRRAAHINPSCVWAYIGLSQLKTATGHFNDGIKLMQQAHDLDPVSPIVFTMLGCAYYFAGDYATAEQVLTECLSIHPGFPIALSSMAWVKIARGRFQEAVQAAHEASERSQKSPLMSAQYSYALATSGDHRKARTILESVNSTATLIPTYWLALCHVALNEPDHAIAMLDQCMQRRCAWRVLLLVDPKLRSLSGDARFRQMLHELHFPEAAAGGR